MEAEQSKMQRGFTNNSSAVNAALIISEAQNEAKDIGEPLKLVTLDACKAFNVVWQESLLRKIYNAGIHGKLWLCLSNLYSGAHSVVKWQGIVSHPPPHPISRLGKRSVRGAYCQPIIINYTIMTSFIYLSSSKL